jgi:radical SAM protein with 4Fe4S-binding SPASM domain
VQPQAQGVLTSALVARTLERAIPLSVQLDLTMHCNERCVHCYRVVERRPELTTGEIDAVLASLARAGTLYLTLSGGEVFLRPDLFGVLAEAKRLRFDVRLKSNALLVDAVCAARVHAVGVRQVDVSIYGADGAVHDGVTGVAGSLERTLAGVRHLREAGLRVRLSCPLMTVNVAAWRTIRALADSLGVPCVFDPMITARNDGERSPVAWRAAPDELVPVFADAAQVADERACDPAPDVPCGAAHNAAYISAYGDVMPCVALPVVCGNVRERPFDAIWADSVAMRRVRSIRVRDLRGCSSCEASAFCSRCPGQALVEDGDLRGPSAAACGQAEAAARAAGRDARAAGMRRRLPVLTSQPA